MWQDFSAGVVRTSGDRGRASGTMTQNTARELSCDAENRLRDKDSGEFGCSDRSERAGPAARERGSKADAPAVP